MSVNQIPCELLEAAVARFDLGRLHNAKPISGGLQHRLYRCTTDSGVFAIKEMVAQAEEPNFKERIEANSSIERLAAAAGIPVPKMVFLPHTSEILAPINSSGLHFVRVHEWLEGSVPVTEEKVANLDWLSETLGNIHALDVKIPEQYQTLIYKPIPWNQWLGKKLIPRPDWFNLLSQALETIRQFESLILSWQSINKNQPVVPSHRDFTTKNILLKDGQLTIVDWDNANWVVEPLQDVFTVAIDWSLARQGRLSEDRITSVVNAYLKYTGYSPALSAYQMYCSDWATGILNWLAFNLSRTQQADVRQRHLGEAEAKRILALLLEVGNWVFGRAHHISIN